MDKFEEYKLFVDDTARFSERRQTVTSTYVAVNSLLVTAVAFLVKDAGLIPVWRTYVSVLLLVAGIVVCLQWHGLIVKYKKLVRLRIDRLRNMEDDPAMTGCARMYHEEDELYPRDEQGNQLPSPGLDLSTLESWLPRTFAALYVLFALGLVALALFAPGLLAA
jgi:hypothetical protein